MEFYFQSSKTNFTHYHGYMFDMVLLRKLWVKFETSIKKEDGCSKIFELSRPSTQGTWTVLTPPEDGMRGTRQRIKHR